jgi:hypothetical protein
MEGLTLFAMDPKGNLYWDGEPVEIQKRFRLTRPQMIASIIVGVFAIAGGAGGAVQGWISYNDWSCKTWKSGWLQVAHLWSSQR